MPFAATGGLGDVMGSLPAAISAADGETDVRVVLPLYGAVGEKWRSQMTFHGHFDVVLAWRRQYCGVFSLEKDGVTYYFLDNEYYFNRPTLYGNFDDGERYAFFCKAAVEMLGFLNYYPDVLHAHDWQAALSLVYLDTKFRHVSGYENIKTVFTIHNIEYQGKYDFAILHDIFDLSDWDRHIVEYDGCINLMKGAIVCANKVSTVSPRYADEIRTAEFIINSGACAARVYPTVVFKETELFYMAKEGVYQPLSLEDAVFRSAKIVEILRNAGVQVIRVGLCSSDNLSSESSYFAGPNHTLPTTGTARFSSPLSVDDFVKKTQYTYYTKEALSRVADDVAFFAEKEGLSAHARSATVRFEDIK